MADGGFIWQEKGTPWKGVGIYHVTLAQTDRSVPLLGRLTECADPAEAKVERTELGNAIVEQFLDIPKHCPQVKPLAFCLMPDHLHGVIYVTSEMNNGIMSLVRGFWQGCKKIGREYSAKQADSSLPWIKSTDKNEEGKEMGEGREGAWMKSTDKNEEGKEMGGGREGAWMKSTSKNEEGKEMGGGGGEGAWMESTSKNEEGKEMGGGREEAWMESTSKNEEAWEYDPIFHEMPYVVALAGKGQLEHMIRYVHDNPRRAAIRRQSPNLYRLRRNTTYHSLSFSSLGNHFLLDWPMKQQVEMSRSASEEQITDCMKQALTGARNGAVTITAAISKGEKRIARAIREAGLPLVILLTDGFPTEGNEGERYYKPGGVYFEACAAGRLLLLEPAPETYAQPQVIELVDETLRKKAEQKHMSYMPIPHDSQRWRFVANNEIGHLLTIAKEGRDEQKSMGTPKET